MNRLILSVFLAVIPFFIWFGLEDGIRFPKEMLSVISLSIISALGIFKYNLKPMRNKWLLMFWVWCIITIFLNKYTIPTYHGNIILNMPVDFLAWKEAFYITLAMLSIYSIASIEYEREYYSFRPIALIIRKDEMFFFRTINVTMIAMCIYIIIQALGFDQWFRVSSVVTGWVGKDNYDGHFTHRLVGTLGNPSILATWIAVCFPFAVYTRSKAGMIVGAIALVLTASASAIGALCAGMVYYVLVVTKHKRRIVVTTLTVILAVSMVWGLYTVTKNKHSGLIHACKETIKGEIRSIPIVNTIVNTPQVSIVRTNEQYRRMAEYKLSDINIDVQPFKNKVRTFFNLTGRIETHKVAWTILKQRPLTGMGLGTFEYLVGMNPKNIAKLKNENWMQLHDEYGQIWFSVGMAGLFIIIAFILSVFFVPNVAEVVALKASFIVFCIIAIALFPMRVAPMSFYGVVITGLLLRRRKV